MQWASWLAFFVRAKSHVGIGRRGCSYARSFPAAANSAVGGALVDRCQRPRPRMASPHRAFRRGAFISHFHGRPGNAKRSSMKAPSREKSPSPRSSCCRRSRSVMLSNGARNRPGSFNPRAAGGEASTRTNRHHRSIPREKFPVPVALPLGLSLLDRT